MSATILKSASASSGKPGLQRLPSMKLRLVLLRRNSHSSVNPASIQPSRSRHSICDNPGSAARARKVLSGMPYVFLDCEGHDSRASDGSEALSLVQMGTPHAYDIFIFDMLALGEIPDAANDVLSLISDPKILKVGWGGVSDYASLARVYKRPIRPFLDLQLVDIHSRIRRREARAVQASRLASNFFPVSAVDKLQIEDVHGLSRMDKALVEHEISTVPLKEDRRARWSVRPLLASDIRYAYNDIARISELYYYFKNSGNLSVKLLADVIAQTAIYMELYCPSGLLNLRKPFFPSNILPLDIINISVDDQSFFTRNKDMRRCKCCRRALSSDSFPFSDVGKVVDGKYMGNSNEKRLTTCRVCTFIVAKEQYIMQDATRKATSFVKKFSSNPEGV